MARFRKIKVSTWGDDKFHRLTPIPPCGQGLWFWLLTNPETTSIPGLFRAGEAGQAEALGWPLEAFRKAFREVSQKGMAKADWKARVVWIPKAVEHNPPESPNVITSWKKQWDEIPECALKFEAFQALKDFVQGLGEGYRKAFKKAFGERCLNQEQEQEQDLKKQINKQTKGENQDRNGHAPPDSKACTPADNESLKDRANLLYRRLDPSHYPWVALEAVLAIERELLNAEALEVLVSECAGGGNFANALKHSLGPRWMPLKRLKREVQARGMKWDPNWEKAAIPKDWQHKPQE